MAEREVLKASVGAILLETGFCCADKNVLESMTQMLQSYVVELGRSAKSYAELAGRTEPMYADVILALVNMGSNVNDLVRFARRRCNRTIVPPPLASAQKKPLRLLQAGPKLPHPSHIPSHLPPFPDPHTYVRTPTYERVASEYETVREKAAVQKLATERALGRFVAHTRGSDSLFRRPDDVFPLIACSGSGRPYLAALLPRDQVFDHEEPPAARKKKEAKEEPTVPETIDNPFLEPVKLPITTIKIKDLLKQ